MTKSAVSYLLRANINNTAWFDVPIIIKNRSSPPKMSCKKGVLKSFAKFTGKHLYQSLFFNKVVGLRFATLLKKRFWHRCFLVNFAKFLRTPFLMEGIFNFRVTKPSYETELQIMTSQTELLTLIFFFWVSNSISKKPFNKVLELVTWDLWRK